MEMSQYLEVFIEESKEHLQNCNEQLLELEKNPQDLKVVNEIFRSAHTLKGMSATMGYEDLANLTHQMENVLDAIRNEKIAVSTSVMDIVFLAVDDLEDMITSIANGGEGKKDVSTIVEQLKRIENGEVDLPELIKDETDDSKELISSVSYDEYESAIIKQSFEQDYQVFEVSIRLREDCVLKAARVYMVFEVLEKMGEIIKSTPPAEQLEEEKFDIDFHVTVVTKEKAESVEELVMKVSEVENVKILSLSALSLESSKQQQETAATLDAALETSVSTEEVKMDLPAINASASSEKDTNKGTVQNKTIRVNIERLDILMNLFEELVIDRGRLEQISKELNHGELNETVERMSRISGDLQNIILNMRMVPVETVFNRFPRMVRQLTRDLKKKIVLNIEGAETELDRTVIDEIGDPLVHLLRNAMDHGIETPEVRMAKGKPEEGQVELRAYHSGNYVFIEIEDDGAGINRDRVLEKAVSKGIITKETGDSMSNQQVFELIMASGFSTAETISDISGRGVGLDVVKTTIESLGGSITIDSIEGQGSRFSIQLPLTLSIISVMLVEMEKEKFAIPLSSIIETALVHKDDILNAHNQKVIDFRGKVVPIIFLHEVFGAPSVSLNDDVYSVVIVRKGDKMAALVVDSFIGQQEVVLKSLGDYLGDVFAISGATILGDGQVALIVDCNALIK
ncbi:chemotaxis protein CheA [Jeotgalibacillus soli]|uniref:Chemotaxis protein CheA n=1 Tax=Jeotgalibacillus soli TaxID=889306 RepID=A0A0C2V7H2_9BACL|nr:chemotaxis protein CheA [Jeotgalibacillus soli]KIL44907.1 chemotaxis protein CheA [Jeotgalibacillus soli]